MTGVYVHVPFCVKKCDYCSFYSLPLQRNVVGEYLTSLKREISLRAEGKTWEAATLFIGGGTPTSLSEPDLDSLLSILNEGFIFSKDGEKTVEANPGTLTEGKLSILRRQGINRISLGVQSFNERMLKGIGRIHSSQDIYDSVQMIRKVGFDNLNLDLIFGLPGQTLEDWHETLEKALTLRPEHISIYGLMVEEGTPLALNARQIAQLPDDDLQGEMYDIGREVLCKEGYSHYETSNYALPGYECRHNLGYWRGKDYLGIGPSAVSCVKNRRFKNLEDIFLYNKMLSESQLPVDKDEDEVLTVEEQRAERIILGLRLKEGIHLARFKTEFGEDIFELYPAVLERYLKAGVLVIEKDFLRLKPEYWFVANTVLQEFV